MAAKSVSRFGGIGDAAIAAKTGKSWNQWVSLLDKAGAKRMSHKEIVAIVSKRFGVGPWWQQMVAVGYEQARGLRVKHQTATGYSISRSATIAAPVSAAYKAWHDSKARGKWLDAGTLVVRKATANKSMRITWPDRASCVETQFYAKGPGKCQVVVQHSKLSDANEAQRKKGYWGKRLEALKRLLEA